MAQLVEQRIRNAWVAGSSPAIGSHFFYNNSFRLESGLREKPDSFFFQAGLAQLVEHWLPKPRVAGSSPVFRSSKTPIIGAKREKLTEK